MYINDYQSLILWQMFRYTEMIAVIYDVTSKIVSPAEVSTELGTGERREKGNRKKLFPIWRIAWETWS